MKLPIGPGALVTAAFVGPGTVTACMMAGADFGYALVWALVFATLAAIVLQEMSARLGVITGKGLGEALLAGAGALPVRMAVAALIIVALAAGNAAYQAGNLIGASVGAEALLGGMTSGRSPVVGSIAFAAGALLVSGSYRMLERFLIALVLLMSLAFAGSVLITRPDLIALGRGLLPSLPQGSLLTAVALIGTTIVPYNLFLHAAAARKKWQGQGVGALTAARSDTAVSVGLGGLISVFILVTAAGSIFSAGLSVSNPADFPRALEPAYGAISKYLIGTGLLAAGLSSAITAPMAAGFAVCELAGKPAEGWLFRVVALSVLMIGAGIALVGFNPLQVILLAQAANGLLLPIVATFLLITMNRKSLLGDYANGWIQNILGGMVLFITIGLGIRLILRAAGVWP